MSAPSSNVVPEMSLPSQYWNAISQEDKNEFIHLRNNFHHGQKISSKDRRIITFSKELSIVLRYLERSEENREERCVLCGVCFVGPIVCVNTRQLKSFLSRCKSSINGSFQQLGFVALRTKAKARSCVLTALPSLQNHQSILRQWTVRYASDEARFCFVSSYSTLLRKMPEISPDDLFDEKKPTPRRTQSSNYFLPPNAQQMAQQFSFGLNQQPPIQNQFQGSSPLLSPQQQNTSSLIGHPFSNSMFSAPRSLNFQPKQIDFELSSIEDFDHPEPPIDFEPYNNFSVSLSYDNFQDINLNQPTLSFDDLDDAPGSVLVPPTERSMTRSQSAFVWDALPDNLFDI